MLNTLKTLLTPIKHLIDRKVDKDKVYLKDETYSKDEVYSKGEVYPKSKVYTKNETYSKDEVYPKDWVYTQWEVYSKDEISPVAISGSYNDLKHTPSIPKQLSDLKNDTFDEIIVTHSNDVSNLVTVSINGYTYRKISDKIFQRGDIGSFIYSVRLSSITATHNIREWERSDFSGGWYVARTYPPTMYQIVHIIIVYTAGTYSINNDSVTFPEAGIYVYSIDNSQKDRVTEIVMEKINKYKVEATHDGGIQITNEETGETRKLAFSNEMQTVTWGTW